MVAWFTQTRDLRSRVSVGADGSLSQLRPRRSCRPGESRDHNDDHVSIFTYSKSPGLLSMPTLGGEIHGAYSPVPVTGFNSEAMKSPSAVDGSQSALRLFQVAPSISTPSGVARISLNSPMARWKATLGSVSLNW